MGLRETRASWWAAALTGLSLVCAQSVRSQSRIEVYKLAKDSPLATDGRLVFAVSDNGRSVLVGSGSSSDWKVLSQRPTPGRIRGLAFGRGELYLSDEQGAVYQLKRGAPTADVIARGAPLVRPSDLAYAGGLLVADPGAGAVFRVQLGTRKVEPFATGLPAGRLHVAADRDAVVVTSPEAGEVREPAPFEHGSVVQKVPSDLNLSVWRTREPVTQSDSGSSPNRRFPLLAKPAAVTVARGNVYIVDESAGAVFVTYRQQSRPVRVVGSSPVPLPTRVLVVGDTLFVLDGGRGVLEPWSLPVPTEFDLGRQPDVALENLYQFLVDNRLMPRREAPWKGSIDATMRAAGVGFGEFSPILESIVCRMNDICGRAPAGATIRVPDVPTESVIDFETIGPEDLRDGTLGDLLDRKVLSPAFADRKSDREIWELNTSTFGHIVRSQRRGASGGSWTPDPDSVRKLRAADLPKGATLTIPVEKVRCLAALPRPLLRNEKELSRLRSVAPGFNWAPLEDIEATAYAASPQDPPSPAPTPPPCDMQAVKQSLLDMRRAISYRKPDALTKVRIAVAEEKGVDVTHPDFGGPQAFAFLSNQPAQPTPSPTPAATPTPSPSPAASAPPPGCDARPVDEAHGTGVAGLIAGRGSLSGVEALAPNVEIVPIRTSDKLISEDIASAFFNRKVKIFNLSLHYRDQLVTHIRRQIRDLKKEALFVVSAGNDPTDGKAVCDSDRPYPAYPVCEGWRTNVLVVAATNLAGDALIEQAPPEPGSNWDERVVSVAAPGTGYFAPGRNGGYQFVRGTSFATPLVAATAALLWGQGVTDPWLIKQRIVSTADVKDNLRTKVTGGGLLNVGRAVTAPSFSVLTDTSGRETVVEVEGDVPISFSWANKQASRTIPLRAVRRLTRTLSGQSYRIVYLDDATESLVIREDIAPGPWPFKYRKVDAASDTGPLVDDDAIENYKDYVGPVS